MPLPTMEPESFIQPGAPHADPKSLRGTGDMLNACLINGICDKRERDNYIDIHTRWFRLGGLFLYQGKILSDEGNRNNKQELLIYVEW